MCGRDVIRPVEIGVGPRHDDRGKGGGGVTTGEAEGGR